MCSPIKKNPKTQKTQKLVAGLESLANGPCVSTAMFVLSGCSLGFLWEWSCLRQLEPFAFQGSKAHSLQNIVCLSCYSCPRLASVTSCGLRAPPLSDGPRTWSCDPSACGSQRLACPLLLGTVWHPQPFLLFLLTRGCSWWNLANFKKVLYSSWSFGSIIALAFSTTSYLKITACLEDSPKPRKKSTQMR